MESQPAADALDRVRCRSPARHTRLDSTRHDVKSVGRLTWMSAQPQRQVQMLSWCAVLAQGTRRTRLVRHAFCTACGPGQHGGRCLKHVQCWATAVQVETNCTGRGRPCVSRKLPDCRLAATSLLSPCRRRPIPTARLHVARLRLHRSIMTSLGVGAALLWFARGDLQRLEEARGTCKGSKRRVERG